MKAEWHGVGPPGGQPRNAPPPKAQATVYRCLHEGIEVLASAVAQLHKVLEQTHREGICPLMLDGTLIPTDRVGERTEKGNRAWCSGKHKRFGGNIQVLTDPTGFPIWTSPVEPEPTPDINAAREYCLGALYPAAAAGLPTLADKGHQGTGIGVHTSIEGNNLGIDNRAYNAMLAGTRAIGERANALLKQRWKPLCHAPSRLEQA